MISGSIPSSWSALTGLGGITVGNRVSGHMQLSTFTSLDKLYKLEVRCVGKGGSLALPHYSKVGGSLALPHYSRDPGSNAKRHSPLSWKCIPGPYAM